MFRAGKYTLPLGKKTYIMGILNYTPDSFSDGGMYNTPDKALEHSLSMEEQGADIIDIGCNSTRPGGTVLTQEEEMARLKEVLPAVCGRVSVPVSVDTFYPACAEYALKSGADIINDVGGSFNVEIAALVKQYGGAYIVSHNPCGADNTVSYPDGVATAVRSFFMDCISKSAECGLKKEQLCLDPGFGFGKTEKDNYELLDNLNWTKFQGYALLAALSRKRFIRKCDASLADYATSAADTLAVAGGADIIRVHNVSAAVAAAKVADAIYRKV